MYFSTMYVFGNYYFLCAAKPETICSNKQNLKVFVIPCNSYATQIFASEWQKYLILNTLSVLSTLATKWVYMQQSLATQIYVQLRDKYVRVNDRNI